MEHTHHIHCECHSRTWTEINGEKNSEFTCTFYMHMHIYIIYNTVYNIQYISSMILALLTSKSGIFPSTVEYSEMLIKSLWVFQDENKNTSKHKYLYQIWSEQDFVIRINK